MEQVDLSPEITEIQLQLSHMNEKFADALEHDVELRDAKILFHEIRILQARLDELVKKNSYST